MRTVRDRAQALLVFRRWKIVDTASTADSEQSRAASVAGAGGRWRVEVIDFVIYRLQIEVQIRDEMMI